MGRTGTRQTTTALAALMALAATTLGAQEVEYFGRQWVVSEGDWQVVEDRLVQRDARAGRAKISLPLQQDRALEYQFDVRYLEGAEDQYAAFGFHMFVDDPARGPAYGNGRSWLLWLTYDPATYGGSGVWAQLYESTDYVNMTRHELEGQAFHQEIPSSYLSNVHIEDPDSFRVPIRVRVDPAKGVVMVADPLQQWLWWAFPVGRALQDGGWVTLRTSGVAASFGNMTVTPVDPKLVTLQSLY